MPLYPSTQRLDEHGNWNNLIGRPLNAPGGSPLQSHLFAKPSLLQREVSASCSELCTPSSTAMLRRRQPPPLSADTSDVNGTSDLQTNLNGDYGENSSAAKRLAGNGASLSAQLRIAREMGFTDGEIFSALEANNRDGEFRAFPSISAMVDALTQAQRQGSGSNTKHGSMSASMNCLAGIGANSVVPRRRDTSPTGSIISLPPRSGDSLATVARSASFQHSDEPTTPALCRLRRNLTHPPGDRLSEHRHFRSAIQRLVDAFDAENRRHFDVFQRTNRELKQRHDAANIELARMRATIRRYKDDLEQQTLQSKRHAELQRRLDAVTRHSEDLTKQLKLRDADALRLVSEISALRRQIEAERRKTEEFRSAMDAEACRRARDNSHAQQIFRENATLKEEIAVKEELIRKIMSSSSVSSSAPSTTFPSSSSADRPECSTERDEVAQLRRRIAALEAENRELAERQRGHSDVVCGVCMDNRREVIFMPCLHFTCCKRCANAVDHCSICRVRIMGRLECFQ